MTLWGAVTDPDKAKTFVLQDPETPFPPPAEAGPTPISSSSELSPSASTKVIPKPTAHLPGDHGSAEGEASKPAFSSGSGNPPPEPTSTVDPSEALDPTVDEGWFPGMYNLVTNSKWVFGAIGAVGVFGLSAAGYFLWRRRSSRVRKGKYKSLAAEDVPMGSVGSRSERFTTGGTKELYDAFGEVSDDEFDDEETGLRRPLRGGADLGFHSGFLDDDDPQAEKSPKRLYQDELVEREAQHGHHSSSKGEASRSPTISADDSWEHASAS